MAYGVVYICSSCKLRYLTPYPAFDARVCVCACMCVHRNRERERERAGERRLDLF